MPQITPEDIPGILMTLDCGDPQTRSQLVRSLCPCRTRCYDKQVWIAICKAYDDSDADKEMQNNAFHVLETLVDRAPKSALMRELLDMLVAERVLTLPLENPEHRGQRRRREQTHRVRVTSRDIPRLLETLNCGDADEQQGTLKMVCPCRNVRYDRELWLAIFRAYEEGDAGNVRDQAGHAIDTLLTRARTDPRSQALLLWLAKQGIQCLPLEHNVPVWKPFGRGGLDGLYIPRFERTPRSKRNRRR